MEIKLEEASEQQVEDILEMMDAFYQIDGYHFDPEITRTNIKYLINNEMVGRLWIILVENCVAGYLALTFGFSFEYAGRDAFLDELFLKEEHRGKGIGTKVMKLMREEAKRLNVNVVHLEVERSNEVGQKLYKKSGFYGNDRILLNLKV